LKAAPSASAARCASQVRSAVSGLPATPSDVARGSFCEDRLLRTPYGWRIESLTQHVAWPEGNTNAVAEATARLSSSR
jgi:hypothetical protein